MYYKTQIPHVEEIEATCQIRTFNHPRAKSIPIVAMTANVFKEDVESCLTAGMNDHIGRPIDFNELMDKLQKLLPDTGI